MEATIIKLRAAAKEYVAAATRPIDRVLTCLEIARRNHWLDRGMWLEILANDLEGDNLMYDLYQTINQEEERNKELLKGNENG